MGMTVRLWVWDHFIFWTMTYECTFFLVVTKLLSIFPLASFAGWQFLVGCAVRPCVWTRVWLWNCGTKGCCGTSWWAFTGCLSPRYTTPTRWTSVCLYMCACVCVCLCVCLSVCVCVCGLDWTHLKTILYAHGTVSLGAYCQWALQITTLLKYYLNLLYRKKYPVKCMLGLFVFPQSSELWHGPQDL